MVKVTKFGGSSLADANQFRKVAAIIRADHTRRYVVASAPGKRGANDIKVTDLLLECFRRTRTGESIDEPFGLIQERFRTIMEDLGLQDDLEPEFRKIRTAILNYAGSDYIASRGEYLNARILAKYLGYAFIDAEYVIYFREDGRLDSERTNERLSEVLSRTPRAVIPGFYGSMPNGTIKTFSRGGSDVTGSIVARAASASLYENWTDVSGMLMADPRIVDDPLPISRITYRELRELAYMGASVLHEEAIFPVRMAGIPINIRNTNRPDDEGTMIVPGTDFAPSSTVITGVAGKKGFSAVYIEKAMMNAELGVGRRVLGIMERHGISFEHLPSGIDTMTVVVNTEDIAKDRGLILEEIHRIIRPDHLTVHDNLALIAVVGRGMIRTPGTAARIFVALANANVNIRMIDQGSSELNIIIAVDSTNYTRAIQAIYNEFAVPSKG